MAKIAPRIPQKFPPTIKAIKTKAQEIYDAIKGPIETAYNWIKYKVGRFWQLGYDIVHALGKGIGYMAGWLLSMATWLVQSVLGTMKSLLGIRNSPSPLFEGYGRGLIESLAKGMDTAAHLPAASLGRIAGGLGASFAVGGADGAGAAGITIHNYFGRDSVRSDRDVYELSEQIKRSLRLRGAREML